MHFCWKNLNHFIKTIDINCEAGRESNKSKQYRNIDVPKKQNQKKQQQKTNSKTPHPHQNQKTKQDQKQHETPHSVV